MWNRINQETFRSLYNKASAPVGKFTLLMVGAYVGGNLATRCTTKDSHLRKVAYLTAAVAVGYLAAMTIPPAGTLLTIKCAVGLVTELLGLGVVMSTGMSYRGTR
jgi:hypothetical protein